MGLSPPFAPLRVVVHRPREQRRRMNHQLPLTTPRAEADRVDRQPSGSRQDWRVQLAHGLERAVTRRRGASRICDA